MGGRAAWRDAIRRRRPADDCSTLAGSAFAPDDLVLLALVVGRLGPSSVSAANGVSP